MTGKGRVLVTGAAGEVGRRLVRRLAADGWRVRGLVLPAIRCGRGSMGPGARSSRATSVSRRRSRPRWPASTRSPPGRGHPVARSQRLRRDQPRRHRATWSRGGRGRRASLRLRLVGVGRSTRGARRTAESKLDAEAFVADERRFAAHHRAADPGLRRDGRAGVPAVPALPAPFSGRPVHRRRARRGSGRCTPTTSSTGSRGSSATEVLLRQDLQLERRRGDHHAGAGELILELDGAQRPFLHLPVPLCRALAALLARVMKRPPITPYAIAGFIHDADLDPRRRPSRDLGYAPCGVRAGLARCFPLRNRQCRRRTMRKFA